ncbi:hypothetical protein ABZ297_41040, partial [Nonomuraea sp. NPDC005983]
MIAVVVSLVAVVLLVLVVVALGMRSMSRRESSLPPERLKQMAEKEEMTLARSTDEFAAHEPRMTNFTPDFSPIDAPKPPKPVRTGQRGKRGVDEWGNPTSDDEDEEFWANIRSDAEEGGFGAGGTVAARKGASRPVERPAAERPAPERPTSERPAPERPAAERPAERERPRRARRERVAADPNAATVQAPLPQRQVPAPAAPAANLADLVEPAPRRAPSASDLADQRTVTFSADVMSILGAGAQQVPPTRPADPLSGNGSYQGNGSGSFPAQPQASSGSFPAQPQASSGSFPAQPQASSGSFPAQPVAPIHGAPTSDPFPAAYNRAADPIETTWTTPPPASTTSGSWSAGPDIFDEPGAGSTPSDSWPAFEQPARQSYPASYEVRSGWAVADDSDPLTGPSPATGTPTAPARAVSAYDDVLSAPPPQGAFAYETGDYADPAGQAQPAAWPEQQPASNA